MKRKIVTVCIAMTLVSGCTTTTVKTRVITPPALLTQPVFSPVKPNSKIATQKDVAVYLVELKSAFDLANLKLQLINEWSKSWMQSTKPNN